MERHRDMKSRVIKDSPTDFETFQEIMDELIRPIAADGLDVDTLKRLYESKLVYLENIRVKCFRDLNQGTPQFSVHDYQLILEAVRHTETHLRELILGAISQNLQRTKVS